MIHIQDKKVEAHPIRDVFEREGENMKKRLTNNLGLKVLAFLIAAFMWLIVVNIDDPITDKTYTNISVCSGEC